MGVFGVVGPEIEALGLSQEVVEVSVSVSASGFAFSLINSGIEITE
jgi:hypothetical protein